MLRILSIGFYKKVFLWIQWYMIQHSSTSLTEIKIFMGGGLFIATVRIPVSQKIEDGIIQDFLNYGSFRST